MDNSVDGMALEAYRVALEDGTLSAWARAETACAEAHKHFGLLGAHDVAEAWHSKAIKCSFMMKELLAQYTQRDR